jgi:hypothetical protein
MKEVGYWGTKWAEDAYRQGLIPSCGPDEHGDPNFCPNVLLDRAWSAFLIARAKSLTLPEDY